jgi:hypothetical protein
VSTFFEVLENRIMKFNELFYSSGGLRIEWNSCWDVIESDSIKIVPLESMPETLLSGRLQAFQKRQALCKPDDKPYKLRMRNATADANKDSWFSKNSKRRTDESDSDYEFRLLRICVALFSAIRDYKPIKKSPSGINPLAQSLPKQEQKI